jgi:hypothetical protein
VMSDCRKPDGYTDILQTLGMAATDANDLPFVQLGDIFYHSPEYLVFAVVKVVVTGELKTNISGLKILLGNSPVVLPQFGVSRGEPISRDNVNKKFSIVLAISGE